MGSKWTEVRGETMPWPITQDDFADATGLTPVHVNRTLRPLREQGVIEFNRRELEVLDPERLRAIAQFNPNYLHLQRTEEGEGRVAERAGDLV